MNSRFALKFGRTLGKNDLSVCWPFSIFGDYRVEFLLHVGLQRLADVDLFSTDLITHCISCIEPIRQPRVQEVRLVRLKNLTDYCGVGPVGAPTQLRNCAYGPGAVSMLW